MDRRSLLAGLGTVVAGTSGCLGVRSTGPASPTATEPEATRRAFQRRTVSLASIDREPREHDVGLTGEVTRQSVTADRTVTLRLTFANEGDDASRNVAGVRDDVSVIAADFSHSAPQEYLLVPPRYAQPDRTDPCWEVPHEAAFNGGDAGGEPIHLSPGESVSQEFRLWDRRPDTPCMPTGNYRFGTEWANEGDPFRWMVTLSVRDPA